MPTSRSRGLVQNVAHYATPGGFGAGQGYARVGAAFQVNPPVAQPGFEFVEILMDGSSADKEHGGQFLSANLPYLIEKACQYDLLAFFNRKDILVSDLWKPSLFFQRCLAQGVRSHSFQMNSPAPLSDQAAAFSLSPVGHGLQIVPHPTGVKSQVFAKFFDPDVIRFSAEALQNPLPTGG